MQKDNNMKYIAFVCTGNTCRSPMAEAIFNKKAEERGLPVRAVSFGLAAVPGLAASEKAIEVCREIGVDLTGHKTHFIYDFQLGDFDKLYCMSLEHMTILTQSVGVPEDMVELLGVVDPYGGSLETYRMCRDVLAGCVEEILAKYEN